MIGRLKRLFPHRHPVRLLWHKAKALLAALRYEFPARGMTVIGVTGTDGKTTTVGMIMHILEQEGIHAGALSTAFFQIKDQISWNATQKTSPSPFSIQKFLRDLKRKGCTHAVLECSSHGLVQGRTTFTWPSVAAITNTSLEHLDYHGTMEQYRADKGILFRMLKGKGVKVLKRDDGTFASYCTIPSRLTVTYGLSAPSAKSNGDLWLTEIKDASTHATATLHVHAHDKDLEASLQLSIPGRFNLENALCAISSVAGIGIHPESAARSLQSFPGVPGRMERIDEGQPFNVYVDFTVTPQSYEATLSTLKTSLKPGQRLLVLTGSCGDRMKEKRPIVGKIVSKYADVMVVANEDPYTEDPEKIIDDVLAGADKSHAAIHRIFDRHKAIEFLLNEAKPGDTILLCGKGSDTTMWVKEGQIPWNEREIARKLLKAYKH